jgi:hypothetical protein
LQQTGESLIKIEHLKSEWSGEQLFIRRKGATTCFVCDYNISGFKTCHVKTRYETKHAAQLSGTQGTFKKGQSNGASKPSRSGETRIRKVNLTVRQSDGGF